MDVGHRSARSCCSEPPPARRGRRCCARWRTRPPPPARRCPGRHCRRSSSPPRSPCGVIVAYPARDRGLRRRGARRARHRSARQVHEDERRGRAGICRRSRPAPHRLLERRLRGRVESRRASQARHAGPSLLEAAGSGRPASHSTSGCAARTASPRRQIGVDPDRYTQDLLRRPCLATASISASSPFALERASPAIPSALSARLGHPWCHRRPIRCGVCHAGPGTCRPRSFRGVG